MKTSLKANTQKIRIYNAEKTHLNTYEKQTPWESQLTVMWFCWSFIQTVMNYRNPQILMRPFWCLPQTKKNLWQALEKRNFDNNMPFEARSSTYYRVLPSLEGTVPGTSYHNLKLFSHD